MRPSRLKKRDGVWWCIDCYVSAYGVHPDLDTRGPLARQWVIRANGRLVASYPDMDSACNAVTMYSDRFPDTRYQVSLETVGLPSS